MTIAVGQSHLSATCTNVTYCFVDYHHMHRPTAKKSVWTIPLTQEFDCFEQTHLSRWFVPTSKGTLEGWGLRLVNGRPTDIGLVHPNVAVKVAEFQSDANGLEWHGYPLHKRGVHVNVAGEWRKAGIIGKKTMDRLVRGDICSL